MASTASSMVENGLAHVGLLPALDHCAECAELCPSYVHFYDTYYRCVRRADQLTERVRAKCKLYAISRSEFASRLLIAASSGNRVRWRQSRRSTCLREPDVCEARLRPAGGGHLHAARRRAISRHARRPWRRVANGHASAAGRDAPVTLAEHGYTAVAISYRLAPKSHVPGADLRLPGGRALAARACQRIQNRSEAHRRLRLLGRRPLGRAAGHARRRRFREDGIPADAPSARLQVRRWPAARRATSAICRPTVGMLVLLAGRHAGPKSRTTTATPRRPTSSPPTIRRCISFHGEEDLLVPISSPQRMVELLQKAGRDGGDARDQKRRAHSGAVRSAMR